jgi:hypothetical protein
LKDRVPFAEHRGHRFFVILGLMRKSPHGSGHREDGVER